MELPNYFFVDLPEQSGLSHELVLEACRNLKRNRKRYLADRSTDSLITVLASVAEEWCDPEFPLRQMALEKGPEATGFSRAVLERGLTDFFQQITPENLKALIVQDLGEVRRMDELAASEPELRQERASIVQGPELLIQITGGLLPNPTFMSMILGLLTRSAQFLKCASGTSFLPRLFGHSLYLREPKLASCLEIAEWKGGNEPLETALFKEATCVTATGGDETIMKIRSRVPVNIRFLGYGHKVSFAFVTREMLGRIHLKKVLQAIAMDIAAWDQLGCLSPHAIYVESGGTISPVQFCEMLAEELALTEQLLPRGRLDTEASAAIALRRMFYAVRAADQENTRVWFSENSTAWSIVYEDEPQFQRSCLNRFIYVKTVGSPEHLLRVMAALEGQVSTVGLSAPMDRAQTIATQLARAGATRVCPIGRMQNPPVTWRHDGRPSLADLVTWTDFELP